MDSDLPIQSDRDLRGAAQDYKRDKDKAVKWKHGADPKGHLKKGRDWEYEGNTPFEVAYYDHVTSVKERPFGGCHHYPHKCPNVNKPNRAFPTFIRNGIATKGYIVNELEAVDAARKSGGGLAAFCSQEPLDSTTTGVAAAEDPFLYSFDAAATTPGQPLGLDAFVKKPTERDTARLVEKEYEVVDENGRALKGKDAKANLRRPAGEEGQGAAVEDGFELV